MSIRHDRDYDAEDERHRRRLMLLRMQGDIGRAERRNSIWLGIAVALAIAALFGSMLG